MSGVEVVANCSPTCKIKGCQLGTASIMVENARRIQKSIDESIKESKVGMALWCDKGKHAFSEKEDNMNGTRKITRDGRTILEDYLICSACMERETGIPAIENVPVGDKVPNEVDW